MSRAFVCILVCALACSRARANEPGPAADNCTSCHSELPGQLREPVRLVKGDVHASAGVSCAKCHGGDPSARTGREAHAKDFLARPVDSAGTAAFCGRCHKEPAANYLKGPHQLTTAAPRRPDCTTCHGSHGVQKASVALIAEPLCSSCHTVAQARRIGKALGDAEREVSALDAQLASTGNHAADRERLMTSRSQLRGLAHAVDLFTITRNAADTLAVVDEVRAKALPKEGAKDWGRRLRIAGIALAAVMLLAGALWGLRALRARKLRLPIPQGRTLTIVASVGGVLLVVAAIGSWRGFHYIEHDPKFCTSCHTMDSAYSLWQQSGHKNVECHTCHEPDVASNLHQLWVYATRKPDEVVKHAQVDRSVCEKCHTTGANASKWNRIQETPGHRVHAGKERVECTQCHAMSVHRFKPPKETCVTCHKKVTLAAAGTMAEMHCLQCHPFMAADAKRSLKPDRAACMECHELRQIKGEIFPAKAPMKWDCGKCHKPHQQMYLTRQDCFKCHDSMTEGVHRVKGHEECVNCHKPHGWTTSETSCATCHTKVNAASHHPTAGKTCKDCHGAWDDEFLPKLKVKTASK